jgi:hypothetical protein
MSLPPVIGDLTPLVPAITLLAFAAITLLFGVFTRERAALGGLALTGVGVAGLRLLPVAVVERQRRGPPTP